jgi:F0F1-type ATP synthase delta subunit
MKQPRLKISHYIADTTIKSGINKHLAKEVAAYLLNENRTSELESILRDVRQDWANDGTVEVIAVSAFDLSEKVRSDIKSEIKKLYPRAKSIIVTHQYDPTVIAGVRLELANQQLDLTVQSKLNKFKQLAVSGKD